MIFNSVLVAGGTFWWPLSIGARVAREAKLVLSNKGLFLQTVIHPVNDPDWVDRWDTKKRERENIKENQEKERNSVKNNSFFREFPFIREDETSVAKSGTLKLTTWSPRLNICGELVDGYRFY